MVPTLVSLSAIVLFVFAPVVPVVLAVTVQVAVVGAVPDTPLTVGAVPVIPVPSVKPKSPATYVVDGFAEGHSPAQRTGLRRVVPEALIDVTVGAVVS